MKVRSAMDVYVDYFKSSGHYRFAGGGIRKCCANCLYFYKSREEFNCDLLQEACEDDVPNGTLSPHCVCDYHRPFDKPLEDGEDMYSTEEDKE